MTQNLDCVRLRPTASGSQSQSRSTASVRQSPPLKGGDALDAVGQPGQNLPDSGRLRPAGRRPPAELTEVEAETLRRQVCGRKARLDSRAARRSGIQARAKGLNLSPYPCPFCSWWHLGHPPKMATVLLLVRYVRFGAGDRSAPLVDSGGDLSA